MTHANKCMESSSIVAVDGSGSSGASTGEVWIHYMWDPTIAPVLTWDTSKLFLNPSVFESQPFVVQCDVVMFCVSHDDVDEEHCYTYIYNINIYIYIYIYEAFFVGMFVSLPWWARCLPLPADVGEAYFQVLGLVGWVVSCCPHVPNSHTQ